MRAIRYRLLTLLLIGVVTSALSLMEMVRVMSVTSGQRMDRARDGVRQECARLAADPAGGREALAVPPAVSLIGMRGGYVSGAQAPLPGLPAGWEGPLRAALGEAEGRRARAAAEAPLGESTLVLCAAPAGAALAWVGLLILPPHFLRASQATTTLLAIATVLLATTSIVAIFSFRRSAAALHRCLIALGDDLSVPVPRPRIRELAPVAEGIASLARRLAQAREAQERLGRELSHKERLAALGRVVAGVAHEVRNPLASIKLRLDLAAAGTKLPEAAERAITHASDEIARLDRLVADLLVVAGRQMGPRGPASLSALARARAEALTPWCATRRVTISIEDEGAGADTVALIDRESVARAIDNLLRNAVEASPPGGAVVLRVRADEGAVRLQVEDAGPGVQNAEELFEPFFTTKVDGTGLGLALSRAIARAHGGDLTYARLGPVTRFELALARGPDGAPPGGEA